MTLPFRTEPDYFNGTNDANAVTFGLGSSSDKFDLGTTAGLNGIGHWFKTRATSGDTRGHYLRLYFEGAGVSGEAARIFGTVNNVTAATGGTVNGAHISLSVAGASGAVSGAGNALRATLGLGAGTEAGGTLAAVQIDSDFAADATVPASAAAIRVTDSGTKVWDNLMVVPNAVTDGMFAEHQTDAMTHSLRCRTAAGTEFFVMCTTTETNRLDS